MVENPLETGYYSFSFELRKIANFKRFIKTKTLITLKIIVPKVSEMILQLVLTVKYTH